MWQSQRQGAVRKDGDERPQAGTNQGQATTAKLHLVTLRRALFRTVCLVPTVLYRLPVPVLVLYYRLPSISKQDVYEYSNTVEYHALAAATRWGIGHR